MKKYHLFSAKLILVVLTICLGLQSISVAEYDYDGEKNEGKDGVVLSTDVDGLYYLRGEDPGPVPPGHSHDIGSLLKSQPQSQERTYCDRWIKFCFNEIDSYTETVTISNIYYHLWQQERPSPLFDIGYCTSRFNYSEPFPDESIIIDLDEYSSIYDDHRLVHAMQYTDPEIATFRGDEIYNFTLSVKRDRPEIRCNPGQYSFVILNLEDNETLHSSDTDGDQLSDYDELFIHVTNPFDIDTDNDGVRDGTEVAIGSDPNNPSCEMGVLIVDAGGSYQGVIHQPIEFQGRVTGGEEPYTWGWNFSDGYTSTTENPVHSFSRSGTYNITLAVTDSSDSTVVDHATAIITEPEPLTIDAGGPYIGFIDAPFHVKGTVTGGVPPYEYIWDFGDGTEPLSGQPNPPHRYTQAGRYPISFTVIDYLDETVSDTTIALINSTPTASYVEVDDDFANDTPSFHINRFNRVQDGINAVIPTGTVVVAQGIYDEYLEIEKPIDILGEDKDTTIIHCDYDDYLCTSIVSISADNVRLQGFTIQNVGESRVIPGITLTSNYTIIQGNVLNNNSIGVAVSSTSPDSICSYNSILENIISYNMNSGVDLGQTQYNTIARNSITCNDGDGIFVNESYGYNLIEGNKIIQNFFNGIHLLGTSNNTIISNSITGNNPTGKLSYFGVKIIQSIQSPEPPDYPQGKGGKIIQEGRGVSITNTIYHNVFNNIMNAYDSTDTLWYSPIHQGNYWSNYNGVDEDGDGIGDTPRFIYPENHDWYPLMHPFIRGDMNVDGQLDFNDIDPFVLALSDPVEYQNQFHILATLHGDCNQDGYVTSDDIDVFIALFSEYR